MANPVKFGLVALCCLLVAGNVNGQIGQGDNDGACFVFSTFTAFCAVDQATCEGSELQTFWYPPGFISQSGGGGGMPNPQQGCCFCCGGCNLTAEDQGKNCSALRSPDGECGHVGGPSELSPFFSDGARSSKASAFLVATAVLFSVFQS